jgi:hypothetical protein
MANGRLLLLLALILAVIPVPQVASAQIVVDIGGSPPQNPGTNPNSVDIAGSYGTCAAGGAAITITPNVAGTPARVEVISDPGSTGIDYLALKNVKITTICTTTTTAFRIAFSFNHVSHPATPPNLRYTYKATGGFSSTAGTLVKVKSSYRNTPPTPPSTAFNAYGAIGNEKQSSALTFSLSDVTANINTVTDPRGLEGEFTFTLPPNATLKMTTYYVQNTTSTGGGGDDHGETGLLTTLCPTLQATAAALGCPSCVSQDGILAMDAKAKIFAGATWNNLSHDLASGQGEYLTSLATLLNVPTDQHMTFFSLATDQYRTLMKTDTPTSDEFLESLRERMPIDISIASSEIT